MKSGQALLNFDKFTVLGVTNTHDLQWSPHGNKVRAKIIARMNTIRRFGRIINANIRLQLFNAYVKPHYKYCLPVWGNTNKSIETKFNKTLKSCTCAITSKNNLHLDKETYSTSNICDFKSSFNAKCFMYF